MARRRQIAGADLRLIRALDEARSDEGAAQILGLTQADVRRWRVALGLRPPHKWLVDAPRPTAPAIAVAARASRAAEARAQESVSRVEPAPAAKPESTGRSLVEVQRDLARLAQKFGPVVRAPMRRAPPRFEDDDTHRVKFEVGVELDASYGRIG